MINLRSEIDCALLGYYFANPDAEHYVRDLSRILSIDVANVSRALNGFAKSGLFVARMSGREKFFRLNQAHPLASELHAILKVVNSVDRNRGRKIK